MNRLLRRQAASRWFSARWLIAGGLLASLGGCTALGSLAYYWQSAHGHLALMQAARPVDDWLQDPAASARLKARLALTQDIRAFAVSELHLPDNASYRRYADLQRPAAVWNVVAAPERSLKLEQWCFPVAGCVAYKGFFNEADAQAEAAPLRLQGLDVSVYPVPAYSTLGWLNWAGGDPLLNTFIGYPDGELARLIFHELAHQVVYAENDSAFNESFATAVERLGSARWLARHASPAAQSEFARHEARRQQFRALALQLRSELEALYGEGEAKEPPKEKKPPAALPAGPASVTGAISPTSSAAVQQVLKAQAFENFRQRYAELKVRWGGYAGYDPWVARANNASLGAMATYDELVPGFEALFERQGRDWPRFYAAVRQLAALPKAERRAALKMPAARS